MEIKRKYLLLLKEENIKYANVAYRKIIKSEVTVTAQHGNVAFEVLCTSEQSEQLFNLGSFISKTASFFSTEKQDNLSMGQKSVIAIWNTKFDEKRKERKKDKSKTGLPWQSDKQNEPAPDMPYDILRIQKEIDIEIKTRKIDKTKLKQGIIIDPNKWLPSDFLKLNKFFSDQFKNEKLGYKATLVYYHILPEYRVILLSPELLDILRHIFSKIDKEDGCWQMHGKNSVGVVFVESSRNRGPKFNSSTRNEITNEIISGLSWLVTQHPSNNLSWVYDFQFVNIDVANQANQAALSSSFDKYWREPAMGEVVFEGHNYNPTDDDIDKYKGDMRVHHESEHAIAIFVTPFGTSWHAYSSGKRFIVLSEHGNDWGGGWGQDELNITTAHEMCHKYGAADEYGGNGTPCSSCGGEHGCDNIPNGNCEKCAKTGEGCIMKDHELNLCQYTRGQIGWSDIFVELFTADELWAGTDDDVSLDIGTRTFNLDVPNHNDRERDNREGYALWAGGNLSKADIKRILFRKSEDGFSGGWKLKKFVVRHNGVIICNQTPNVWLEDDNRALLGCVFDNAFVNTLKVEIKTADVLWAGTDDDVTLMLAGRSWSLDNSGNDFERGDTNTFILDPQTNFKVSDITTITIEKSSDGFSGGWKLEGVKLTVNGLIIYNRQNINRWLEDDNLIFTDAV